MMEVNITNLRMKLRLPEDTQVFAQGYSPGSYILFAIFEREQRYLVTDMHLNPENDDVTVTVRVPRIKEDDWWWDMETLGRDAVLPPPPQKWWTRTGYIWEMFGGDMERGEYEHWNKPFQNFVTDLIRRKEE